MAGTLTVQNIEGPSSGANANKIIIPSGQTLDASGGTLVPSAGAVVKTETFQLNSSLTSTSSSYQDVLTISFTPLYDNSFLLISGVICGIAYQTTSVAFQGSQWRYVVTPSGGSSTEVLINNYQFHFPLGEYYGGTLPFNFKYAVSSTVSHDIKIQGKCRNSHSNALRNRNGENSFISVQEIAQ